MFLASPRLGQPQKPVELVIGPASMVWKLPHLHCTKGHLDKVSAAMGRPVTRAEVKQAILKAGEQGQNLAVEAWFKLHDKKLPADVEQLFKAAFGVASTARPSGSATSMHSIVAARYKAAIRKLGDDAVRVSCWGWPWGGITDDRPEAYFANSVPGRHGIALGKLFWVAFKDGDTTSLAAIMLAKALSINYYKMRFGAQTPRTVRTSCYVRFAILSAGQQVPAWVEARCAPH